MFSNGFGVSHEIFVEAQMFFSILIKGFNRSAQQVRCDDMFCTLIQAIGHQNDKSVGEFLILITDHQVYFPQRRDTQGDTEGPKVFLLIATILKALSGICLTNSSTETCAPSNLSGWSLASLGGWPNAPNQSPGQSWCGTGGAMSERQGLAGGFHPSVCAVFDAPSWSAAWW